MRFVCHHLSADSAAVRRPLRYTQSLWPNLIQAASPVATVGRIPREKAATPKECPNAAHTNTTIGVQLSSQGRQRGGAEAEEEEHVNAQISGRKTTGTEHQPSNGREGREKVKSIYVVPCQRRTTACDFKPFNLQAS